MSAIPVMSPALRRLYQCRYDTIRLFTITLLRFVNSKDEDGRDRGLDYETIHRMILRKYPVVFYSGPRKGKPTLMTRRHVYEIARLLKLGGERLPSRFTAPRHKRKT
jgi:hypothetical protein